MIRKTEFNYATGVNKKFIYSGYQYAITATGGFSLKEQSQQVKVNPIENIGKFNVSNSVQILLSNQLFNSKLGGFNIVQNQYNIDTLTITAAEFASAITESQINTVGKFETIYADFAQYVDEFLNYEEGFSSIYYMEEPLHMKNEEFTSKELFNLITKQTNNSYGTYNEIFGNINIYGVNNLLSNAKKLNIFGNRADSNNISDGFLEGDIVYIPYGIDITLTLELDANNLRLNDMGKANIERMNKLYDYDDGNMCQTTIANIYRIQRNVKMPLFIKLINIGLPSSVISTTKTLTDFTKHFNKTIQKPTPIIPSAPSLAAPLLREKPKTIDLQTNTTVITKEELEKRRNFKLLTKPKTIIPIQTTKIETPEPEPKQKAHTETAPHLGPVHEQKQPIIMQQTRARIPSPPPPSPDLYKGIIHKKRINITKQFM